MNTSFVAPVRRLPPDVLLEIFKVWEAVRKADREIAPLNMLLGIEDPEKDRRRKKLVGLGDPIYSRVCVAWRHVALSAPQLWTFISLDSTWRFSNMKAGALDGLQRYISQSQQVPLHIRISHCDTLPCLDPPEIRARADLFKYHGFEWTVEGPRFGEAWEQLYANAHRWKSAALTVKPSFLRRCALKAFDCLESVEIYLGRDNKAELLDVGGSRDFLDVQPLDLFSQAPNVRQASIRLSRPLQPYLNSMALPSSWRLTTLSLAVPSDIGESLRAIRQSAGTLITLSLSASHPDRTGDYDAIEFPVLESLTVNDHASDILEYITVPSMQSLSIRFPPHQNILSTILDMIDLSDVHDTLRSFALIKLDLRKFLV
ncbi:hypothetical protein BD626DRAFT_503929 [Schizophyllum amplum]|uniref:Uncharacterized protein n=1 Tax=Schizophyllum amplum TaxID=97359 RepID=A0A550C7M1_9AGAR|nr:hypothetical protein BD626DRAFT_503929 [Auriculariopsis ampla]